MDTRQQRGQALILIALAFVGLAAFIGLAVDAGILFTQIGHLRRAVDAAALAAANQFREGRDQTQLNAAATEFINLNSLNPATAQVLICETPLPGHPPYDANHDPTLCPPNGGPFFRKFVRVIGQMPVDFVFLPIIGMRTVTIHAEAITEAASLDLVLVIDTSASEAFDLCTDNIDNDGDGVVDDCNGFATQGKPPKSGATEDGDPTLCNAEHAKLVAGDPTYNADNDCHPFEEIRTAASGMVDRMKFPYDRMAIIHFSQFASSAIDLPSGTNKPSVVSALGTLSVDTEPPCPGWGAGDPRGCTSTNTAEALLAAGSQFGASMRQEAVWIVILLSDGGANAARDGAGAWICPGGPGAPDWIQPFCRDPVSSTRHVSSDSSYDADDAARDAADWVGCPDSNSPQPAACAAVAPGGQGAVIFTIGLGNLTVNSETCDPWYAANGITCEPDLGERLLRYVAGAGDDGNPATPSGLDPCWDSILGQPKAVGTSCGNYYFSPTGGGLMQVFEAIASRIFTRITH